jgi:hypothetical protein
LLQKFSIVLKKILPDTVYERMLMNHYKLWVAEVLSSWVKISGT